MAVNTDPGQHPNLRVALQRKLGGILLEAHSTGQALQRHLKRIPKPEHRFILFGRGRSGSTLLVSMLDNHPAMTCAGEVLRFRTLNPTAHLNRVLDNGGRPVSGAKLLSYQMRSIHNMPPETDFLRRLADDGVTIIYLLRENLVRHAVSNIYARTQRVYHVTNGSTPQARPKITLTAAQISSWIDGSARLGDYEQSVLRNVPHLKLTYETNLATPAAREATWTNLLSVFGQNPQPLRTTLQKVTADDLRQVIENYDEVMSELSNTPYARYLPDISA